MIKKLFLCYLISILIACNSSPPCNVTKNCGGGPTPTPVTMSITVQGNSIFVNGKKTFMRGYSGFGSCYNAEPKESWDAWFSKLEKAGVNYSRVWLVPIPDSWVPQGYVNMQNTFLKMPNGKYDLTKLNPKFVENVHNVLNAGARHGIVFQVSLADKVLGKYPEDFKTHPYNKNNGGFITPNSNGQGWPQGWELQYDQDWKNLADLYMSVLSIHTNVLIEVINEPEMGKDNKLGTPEQINRWHMMMLTYLRNKYPGVKLVISPVRLSGLKFVPDINLPADIISAHGAGFLPDTPKGRYFTDAEMISEWKACLSKMLGKPVICDDDGLPRERNDNKIVMNWRKLSEKIGFAGFQHRDDEFVPPGSVVDDEAIKVIGANY